jgi:hypothetical protein
VRASYRATMTAPDSARASSVYPSPSGRSKASTTTGESRSPWRPQPRLPAQTVLGRPRSGTAPRTPPTVSKPAADRRRRHRARFPHHAGGRALLQPCRRVGYPGPNYPRRPHTPCEGPAHSERRYRLGRDPCHGVWSEAASPGGTVPGTSRSNTVSYDRSHIVGGDKRAAPEDLSCRMPHQRVIAID